MKSRVHTKPHAYIHFNGTPITWLFCPDLNTNDPKLRLTCWTFTFFGGEFCYAQSNRQNGQYLKNIVSFIFVICLTETGNHARKVSGTQGTPPLN